MYHRPTPPSTPQLSEFICGPCRLSRIFSRGVLHCRICKEHFCSNCCKLHRMKEWSQNHPIIYLDEATSNELKNIFQQKVHHSQTSGPQRWSRRAPLNEGFESKSKYLNMLARNHDHEADDLDNEYFCYEHKIVFCNLCGKEHLNCKNINPISEVAERLRRDGDVSKLTNLYRKCNKFAGILIEDRIRQERNIQSQKADILPKIKLIRRDIEDVLHENVVNIENELNDNVENKIQKIHAQSEKCRIIQQMTRTALEDLRGTVGRGYKSKDSSLVKTYYKLQVKYSVYEKCLREIYNESKNSSVEFLPDKYATTLPKLINSVGTPRSSPKGSTLPPFMCTENLSPFSEMTPKLKKEHIRLWGLGVLGKGGINSMHCTKQGYVAVVTRTNCEFRIFTERGWTVAFIELSSLPWDFTFLTDNLVAVTLPGELKIAFLHMELEFRKITCVKTTTFEDACSGISHFNGRLVGTFSAWLKEASIKFFTVDGTIEKVIEFPHVPGVFRAPLYICCCKSKLYVSDSGNNSVIAFDAYGNVSFVFKDQDFIDPTAMVVDCQDNLYVCAKSSHNIFQISQDGKVREILSEDNGISRPCGISFSNDGSTLLVACSDKTVIRMYSFN